MLSNYHFFACSQTSRYTQYFAYNSHKAGKRNSSVYLANVLKIFAVTLCRGEIYCRTLEN